ncbi:hypothetical protein Mapa_008244 [Marchantia paleacea]|nr:hypothetical protein Mapa_008244 [Marchantia paleacea]
MALAAASECTILRRNDDEVSKDGRRRNERLLDHRRTLVHHFLFTPWVILPLDDPCHSAPVEASLSLVPLDALIDRFTGLFALHHIDSRDVVKWNQLCFLPSHKTG